MITYSNKATIDVDLLSFKNSKSLSDVLYKIPYKGKNTRIDLALQLLYQAFFTVRGGMRPVATRVAILITDGFQTRHSSARSLKDVAKELEKNGIKLLVVGIGDSVNEAVLRSIVSRDDDLFYLKHMSLENFIKIVKPLTSAVCTQAGRIF